MHTLRALDEVCQEKVCQKCPKGRDVQMEHDGLGSLRAAPESLERQIDPIQWPLICSPYPGRSSEFSLSPYRPALPGSSRSRRYLTIGAGSIYSTFFTRNLNEYPRLSHIR